MKKIYGFVTVMVCLAFVATAMGAALFPSVEGQDVLVPDRVIKAIPGYEAGKSVYAAHDVNGWFVRPGWSDDQKKAESEMRQEGDMWRARGLKGQRFHPVQLDADGKPIWALLENVYPLDSPFINNKGPGPCLQVN